MYSNKILRRENSKRYKAHRSALLGQPFDKGTGKLKKLLLFDLASRLNLAQCFRCGKPLEAHDFAVDHKEPWMSAQDPVYAFFDLNNIAFSHGGCNVRAGSRPSKKIAPAGQQWCTYIVKRFTRSKTFVESLARTQGMAVKRVASNPKQKKWQHIGSAERYQTVEPDRIRPLSGSLPKLLTEFERLVKQMNIYHNRIIAAICILLVLAATGIGQTPKREPFKFFTASDATYWGGAVLDLGSSVGKREANPFNQNQTGVFSPGKNAAFKFGLWSACKLLESHYSQPSERRLIGRFKIGTGAAFALVSIWNFTRTPPGGHR